MADIKDLGIQLVSRATARQVVNTMHYMKTFPAGSVLHLGIMSKSTKRIVGIAVFGYSSGTEAKVGQIVTGLQKNEYLEMQRLWISDRYGHNAESYTLGKIMAFIKEHYDLKVVLTHAGGCKNDCGIVYQASSWLYFGRDKCDDFYLTKTGEYKNIIAALRFGRASAKGKTKEQVAFELFGEGDMIDSWRYTYIYPLHRGIRRRLEKISLPYPKDSEVFRRGQQWITN